MIYEMKKGISKHAGENAASFIRQAISADKRSIYAIAKQSGIATAILYDFIAGRRDIRLSNADKLMKCLALKISKIPD
jgi:predicted transcriptional regulator